MKFNRYYGKASLVDLFRYYGTDRNVLLPSSAFSSMLLMLPYGGVNSFFEPIALPSTETVASFTFTLTGASSNTLELKFAVDSQAKSFMVTVSGRIGTTTVAESAYLYYKNTYVVGGENSSIFGPAAPTAWTDHPNYWAPFVSTDIRAFNFGTFMDTNTTRVSSSTIPAPVCSEAFNFLRNLKFVFSDRSHIIPFTINATVTPPQALDVSPLFNQLLNYPITRCINTSPEFTLNVGVDGGRVLGPSDTSPLGKLGDVFIDIEGNKWMCCKYGQQIDAFRSSYVIDSLDAYTDVFVDELSHAIAKKGMESGEGYMQGVIHEKVEEGQYILVKIDK
jgi:hypothetical protein